MFSAILLLMVSVIYSSNGIQVDTSAWFSSENTPKERKLLSSVPSIIHQNKPQDGKNFYPSLPTTCTVGPTNR